MSNKKEENLCIICMTNNKSILSLPCGHMSYCSSCIQAKNFNDRFHNECAVCRENITETIVLDHEDLNRYCSFCYSNPNDFLISPCHHLFCCSDCVDKYEADTSHWKNNLKAGTQNG